MRERLLLLAMAYPEISKKYGSTVCIAGITDKDELRRAYPIPFHIFSQKIFHKRRYIEYDIRGEGDYRKESRKIELETISILNDEISYEEIRELCKSKLTTLEELHDD
jgi:hypothetical protein